MSGFGAGSSSGFGTNHYHYGMHPSDLSMATSIGPSVTFGSEAAPAASAGFHFDASAVVDGADDADDGDDLPMWGAGGDAPSLATFSTEAGLGAGAAVQLDMEILDTSQGFNATDVLEQLGPNLSKGASAGASAKAAVEEEQTEEDIEAAEAKYCARISLRALLQRQCLSDAFSDAHLRVQGKLLPIHRFLVATRSPVLGALLYPHGAKHAVASSLPDVVDLDWPDVESVEAMVQYMYSDNLKVHDAMVAVQVYRLAKEMEFERLRRIALKRWTSLLDARTALMFVACEERELSEQAETVILRDAAIIVGDLPSESLTREVLAMMLESDSVQVREVELFITLHRWATYEAGKNMDDKPTPEQVRQVMGDMIHNVRFPVMTLDELSRSVRPTNILTDEELLPLLTYAARVHANLAADPPPGWKHQRYQRGVDTQLAASMHQQAATGALFVFGNA